MSQSESMQRAADFLVAHRGDRAGGVENTLPAFAAAAAAGARFAECDIQFSRDLVPMVIHDNRLTRLCRRPDVRVSHTEADRLREICRPHFPLATLSELLDWLRTQPRLTLFIEIKPPVRRRLADRPIIRRLAAMLPAELLPRLVLISESAGLIDACAGETGCALGWVAKRGRQPRVPLDYVFLPWKQAGDTGSWQARGVKVALYTVDDAARAADLKRSGADLVETNRFSSVAAGIG